MNIAFAGNTSLTYYCIEKLSRMGITIAYVFLPRKNQSEVFDMVDISPIAGEFNIKQVWLPLAKDDREALDFDLLIRLEWPERYKIPGKPKIATLGSNLFCQYAQGNLYDVAAAIYKEKANIDIQLTASTSGDMYSRALSTKVINSTIFDDVKSLKSKAAIMIADMLIEFLDKQKNGGSVLQLSSENVQVIKAKIDRVIDWRQNVAEIHNHIKALTHPGPGSYSQFEGNKLYVWHGHPFDIDDTSYKANTPGTVLDVIEELGVVVKAKSGAFLITRIQPAGMPELPAWVWAYEFHTKPGDRFDLPVEVAISSMV